MNGTLRNMTVRLVNRPIFPAVSTQCTYMDGKWVEFSDSPATKYNYPGAKIPFDLGEMIVVPEEPLRRRYDPSSPNVGRSGLDSALRDEERAEVWPQVEFATYASNTINALRDQAVMNLFSGAVSLGGSVPQSFIEGTQRSGRGAEGTGECPGARPVVGGAR